MNAQVLAYARAHPYTMAEQIFAVFALIVMGCVCEYTARRASPPASRPPLPPHPPAPVFATSRPLTRTPRAPPAPLRSAPRRR